MVNRSGVTTDSAGSPDRLLHVRRRDGQSYELFLRPGLTIGRTGANDIRVEGDDVDRVHARIELVDGRTFQIRCLEPGGNIAVGSGLVGEFTLDVGSTFRIGDTEFECVSVAATPDATKSTEGARCPFCGESDLVASLASEPACRVCGENVLPVWLNGRDAAPILVPLTYGEYRAERFVAAGGMGLVLKGQHSKTGQAVAIKLARPEIESEPNVVQRFQKEIRLLSRIRHPNVVRFLDQGSAVNVHYVVMDWIEGVSLREIIDTARAKNELVDFATAEAWFGQICRGLFALHSARIVHRDLKPANILIGKDGQSRIADFGIAREFDSTAAELTGQALGTFAYLAPEQINKLEEVDSRADLYSLGATYYELLTGSLPWGTPLPPPSNLNPTVPPAFDTLLFRLLARSAADRPQNAREVIALWKELRNRVDQPSIGSLRIVSPRALIFGGAVFGCAVGSLVGFFLEINIWIAAGLGTLIGSVTGGFTAADAEKPHLETDSTKGTT